MANLIEGVTVHWPGGGVEVFERLQVDSRYRLVEGKGSPKESESTSRNLAVAPGPVTPPRLGSAARIPLIPPMRVPEMEYQEFDTSPRPVSPRPGRSLLVNLWATWCRPCATELVELGEREKDLREKGIDVLALLADGLKDERANPNGAAPFLKRIGFPFSSGFATLKIIRNFQDIHDHLMFDTRSLPVPVSFLIDPEGRLVVIYR